jgi:hypothetical protein
MPVTATSKRKSLPKTLVVGVMLWVAGLLTLQLRMLEPANAVELRSYRITLGALTCTGFVLTVFGAIKWWRNRHRHA